MHFPSVLNRIESIRFKNAIILYRYDLVLVPCLSYRNDELMILFLVEHLNNGFASRLRATKQDLAFIRISLSSLSEQNS